MHAFVYALQVCHLTAKWALCKKEKHGEQISKVQQTLSRERERDVYFRTTIDQTVRHTNTSSVSANIGPEMIDCSSKKKPTNAQQQMFSDIDLGKKN